MTSVNQHRRPLTGGDNPLRFAVLMDLAWRAFRRRMDEEVRPRVAMTKQALGEFVATLQDAGLVEVTVDQRDRRVRLIRPTPAGQELQRVIESAIAEIERRWAAEVGPERWATFRAVLAEIGR